MTAEEQDKIVKIAFEIQRLAETRNNAQYQIDNFKKYDLIKEVASIELYDNEGCPIITITKTEETEELNRVILNHLEQVRDNAIAALEKLTFGLNSKQI